jgi:hypothetical protein
LYGYEPPARGADLRRGRGAFQLASRPHMSASTERRARGWVNDWWGPGVGAHLSRPRHCDREKLGRPRFSAQHCLAVFPLLFSFLLFSFSNFQLFKLNSNIQTKFKSLLNFIFPIRLNLIFIINIFLLILLLLLLLNAQNNKLQHYALFLLFNVVVSSQCDPMI